MEIHNHRRQLGLPLGHPEILRHGRRPSHRSAMPRPRLPESSRLAAVPDMLEVEYPGQLLLLTRLFQE